MADDYDLNVQVRILPLIGPGKMQLLEAIDRHGSISAAARVMGIYRSVEAKAKIMFAGDVDALRHLLAPRPPADDAACDAIEAGPDSSACREKKSRRRTS